MSLSARLDRTLGANAPGATAQPKPIKSPYPATPPPSAPPVDEALVAHLRYAFRGSFNKNNTIDDYRRLEGAHEVIAHLEGLLLAQNP